MSPLRFFGFFRRARTSRTAVAIALSAAVIAGAACQGTKAPPPIGPPPPPEMYCHPTVPTTPDQYQAVFDALRASNAGYFVAADGAIPIPLPDGKILWFFGDTVLGRWTPGGPVSPYLGLASNSFVLQQGGCFKPLLEAIPDLPNGEWIWPTGAVVDGSLLRVFGQHMRKTGSGPFGFQFVQMDVATFSLPGLSLQSITKLPVPTSPNYGETVFIEGGVVYAYGRIRQPGFPTDHHFVARAPLAGIFTASMWEYWKDDSIAVAGDGTEGWTTIAADRDPMAFEGSDPDPILTEGEGPVAGFPVAALGGGAYLGSALHFDVLPGDLETWHSLGSVAANKPAGPWDVDDQLAYDVPDYTPEDRFAYGGRVVLGLPNGPLAIWSINHESFDAVLANPKLYEVAFIGPNGSSLTPP